MNCQKLRLMINLYDKSFAKAKEKKLNQSHVQIKLEYYLVQKAFPKKLSGNFP